MNSKLVSALVWVAVMSVLAGCHSNNAAQSLSSDPWQNAERIVARIKPPIFPARDFDVTTYGAVAGGEADNTGAFRSAIQACHDAGGGRVVVPAGVFLSGPIHLKSGVNLHLKEGSTIRFTTNTAAYMPVVFTRFECIELLGTPRPSMRLKRRTSRSQGRARWTGRARCGIAGSNSRTRTSARW